MSVSGEPDRRRHLSGRVTALTDGQTALNFAGINVPAAGCTITLTR